ncbi:MAG: hypothetical protein DLM72_14290 [Candidatus Nitrosopolaris wilkensis]|nr:MAG: hypothetical protein DLM72_14290 [Candidatus Nitrosopolaris wilkensis]
MVLFIALVGYFTGLLTTYKTHRIVVISFSGIMAASGFVLCLIWWYATHTQKLVVQDMGNQLIRYFLVRTFVPPLIFLTSIGISFINLHAAQYFWDVIISMKHIPDLRRL